jgi:TolB-like protein/DNA-binding winged helix-turn-helix (wHTH) protein/Tfp pilus assembly protein PilF
MSAQTRKARFGVFEADLRAGELRKHGVKIKLQDQPFQILALLLERPGEVVTRDELQHKLWPADTFVDFDTGLNTAIKRLRDTLGDSAESPRFVETLPRRGYRFIASVEHIDDLPVHTERSPEQRTRLVAVLQPEKLWIALGLVAAILALLLSLNIRGFRQRFLRTNAATKVQSIAVLPLENLSGDPAQEYFADGMTEALITDLGKIGELRVISRTSVMRFKDTKKPLREIARELQVDAVVEGTVVRSGDRVRITANLVQASPEKHLWADSFERDLRDVLTLQDDVSRAIANGIRIRLTPQEQARLASAHPVNPEAYEAYLEGRYFYDKLWPGGGPKASEYFELAIEKDPAWALPYSGLADSYLTAGATSAIPNEFCRKAKAAALEAVKRDDEAAETHAILANVEFWCDWDWVGAEREIRQAIELNPNFAGAHSSHGRYLLTIGRADEGLAETKRAVELDPLSPEIRWDRWMLLYMVGQYDGAAEQCRKIQELNPNNANGHMYCGDVEVQKGNLAEAIRELQEAVSLSEGRLPRPVAHLAYAYALAGRRSDAQNLLAKLLTMSNPVGYLPPVLVARVYAGLGQKQDAFEWLEKAYQAHGMDLLELKYDPRFASLRSDPRFADLVRRIGLPP